MSAIVKQKELLAGILMRAGLPAERVAFNNEVAMQIESTGACPWAKIISLSGRFEVAESHETKLEDNEVRYYKQLRNKVVQPFVVQVLDTNEAKATALIETMTENLPYYWEYKDIKGTLEPKECEYSDIYSAINGQYKAALLVEFEMDMGPDAVAGVPIAGVDVGE